MRSGLAVRGCTAVAVLAAISLLGMSRHARADDAAASFQPTWESLEQYQCPDWFRDAKFGIWAHWSAQCQPEEGDWYARNMYQQGSGQYKYHVEHYGHPSKLGFKDIDHLWHAENWDPERLMALYKRAGAKYFVALGNHHDNFDCWNSKYQQWNSVNIGPKKDLVGGWAQAARRNGLRFGVTVHAARAWSWFEVAQGSDKTGPLAGVPYDGTLTKAAGKGQWWEGYDPQDLYAQNHKPGATPDQAYIDKFYSRVIDLVDNYRPDLLYFDDGVLPLNGVSDAGLRIAAQYYNASRGRPKSVPRGLATLYATHYNYAPVGATQAVMNTKGLSPDQRKALVWDIERGRTDKLEPYPWQTDTCIGQWHYLRDCKYKTAAQVLPTLVDIVSKNGNLLLNIPVRGDGTIDDDEVAFLEEMAKWMAVNGECLFGTRPWVVYGEGRPDVKGGGNFNEGSARPYTPEDIRFTTKGGSLYAIVLAWPGEQAVIRALGKSLGFATRDRLEVRLLGHDGVLPWTRDDDGLKIKLPAAPPCDHAVAFKITGLKTNWQADTSDLPWLDTRIAPRPDGSLKLEAALAEVHGSLRTETKRPEGNIGSWDNAADWASWSKVEVREPGTYEVSVLTATPHAVSEFTVKVGDQVLTGKVTSTGAWEQFRSFALGTVDLKQPGEVKVAIRPRTAETWKAINLGEVVLRKQ